MLEGSILYQVVLVFHVLSATIAVGAVTVVDYLHIVGLRNKNLETRSVVVYPYVAKLIIASLVALIVTGGFMLWLNSALWLSKIFRLKLVLVAIIGLNAFILHGYVSPALSRCVREKTHKHCTRKISVTSALAGGVSIVTWYSVFILSMTKHLGYTASQFLIFYLLALGIVSFVALSLELKIHMHSS